ncbi:MAG: hypothetical protein GF398_21050 [Chitinivibrionales bacterium]|nr:hypothetical protein [Chitinivibrionales bacterium]
MNNLAIVPVRTESQRFENKYLKTFRGKPLIEHTLCSVINSKLFQKIIVTSDSDIILESCKKYENKGVELNKRPRKLTRKSSTILETIDYFVQSEIKKRSDYEALGYFLPTVPLRRSKDIVKAFGYLKPEIDSVISITDFEFPPQLGLVLDSNNLLKCYDASKPWIHGKTRAKDYERTYRPNGAINLIWWKSFLINKNFFSGKAVSYYMPRALSVDLETELDMLVGEEVIKYFSGK